MLASTFHAAGSMFVVTLYHSTAIPVPSAWQVAGLLALGLVTAVPFELFARAAGHIRASTLGMLLSLELVPPAVWGAFFFARKV